MRPAIDRRAFLGATAAGLILPVRPALARLWPIKRFPLLVDEERGATIMEASCIIEYLGLHRPGPVRLLPEDAQAALDRLAELVNSRFGEA